MLAAAATFIGSLLLTWFLGQTRILFPAPVFQDLPLPDGAEAVLIQTPDRETLRAIHLPRVNLEGPGEAGTIIFFHGNGRSAEFELERGLALRDAGY
jgi:hypothetical protein